MDGAQIRTGRGICASKRRRAGRGNRTGRTGTCRADQKQRLSVARALVKNPDILILDDSSSALDYATDLAMRTAIANLPKKPTLFIVSQRTVAIEHADKILVLEDGHLAGCGTHKELLENCGVYKEIYKSAEGKEDGENE